MTPIYERFLKANIQIYREKTPENKIQSNIKLGADQDSDAEILCIGLLNLVQYSCVYRFLASALDLKDIHK